MAADKTFEAYEQLQENLLLVSLRSRFNISLVASVAQASTGQHLRTRLRSMVDH